MKAWLKTLGEHIRELFLSRNSNKQELANLDHVMGEGLPNVDVLGPFASANDVVAPFDARIIVFVDWRPFLRCEPHVLEEATEVYYFNSR